MGHFIETRTAFQVRHPTRLPIARIIESLAYIGLASIVRPKSDQLGCNLAPVNSINSDMHHRSRHYRLARATEGNATVHEKIPISIRIRQESIQMNVAPFPIAHWPRYVRLARILSSHTIGHVGDAIRIDVDRSRIQYATFFRSTAG